MFAYLFCLFLNSHVSFQILGVHVLLKSSSGLRYAVYSLASTRPDPGGIIQAEPASFLMQTVPSSVRLYPSGTVRKCFLVLK